MGIKEIIVNKSHPYIRTLYVRTLYVYPHPFQAVARQGKQKVLLANTVMPTCPQALALCFNDAGTVSDALLLCK